MKVLPDTSVWVSFFRRGLSGPAGDVARLAREGSLVVCGPVLAELVAGTRPEHREHLAGTVGSLPSAEVDQAGWWQVGEAAHALRRLGETVPLTDVVIAVAAIRAGAMLWTTDRDFQRIREVLPALELRPQPAG